MTPPLTPLPADNTYRDAIIANGYDVATMGNGTVDDTWPTCVGCAIISRSLDRTNSTVPEVCKTCFTNFCWDGTVNSTTPNVYEPALKLPDGEFDVQSGAAATIRNAARMGVLVSAAAVATAGFLI